jgi:hypothetical protein
VKHRIFWPIVGGLGLALLILVLNSGSAQRPPDDEPRPAGPPPGGPMPSRFVVAHATADRVVILDTVTGQVYVARERDFKSMDELPGGGTGRGFRPSARDPGGKDKAPRRPIRDRIQQFREKDKDGEKKEKGTEPDKANEKDSAKDKDKG